MSDLAEALATKELTPFEAMAVIKSAVEIPGAAGGLREAMKFDPVELHHGQRITLVMECDVTKIRFDPIKDSDCLRRVHVLTPVDEGTTFIDPKVVRKHIESQRERIRLFREEAAGIQRLDGTTPAVAEDEEGFYDPALDPELEDGSGE